MRGIVLFFCTSLSVACSNMQSNEMSSGKDSNYAAKTAIKSDFTNDSIITVQFPKDSAAITIFGRLRGINNPVTMIIPVKKGDYLKVVLTPVDSTANICINQIFFPDGKADGPFGRALEKKVLQSGWCKIIIGENLMQGDEWKGKFAVDITKKNIESPN